MLVGVPISWQIYLDKKRNPLTFRDQCYTSKYTGITSAAPKIPYMEIQDDSKETYMSSGIVDKNAGGKAMLMSHLHANRACLKEEVDWAKVEMREKSVYTRLRQICLSV